MPRVKAKVEKTGRRFFTIRFSGEGMSPKTVRLGELAEVLRSIEDALAAIMGLPPEEVVLGLVGVKAASAGYACALPSREAERALDAWSGAIQSSDFSTLPEAAIEPSRKILAFVRRKNCRAEFRKGNSRTPLAQMTPDTVIDLFKCEPLIGHTTIYGYCQRVGGTEPKLWMRLADRSAVTLDVPSEELARELGQQLYRWIGVTGRAKWHAETRKLIELQVDDLIHYDGPGNVLNGLMEVGELCGPAIVALTGADVAALRD